MVVCSTDLSCAVYNASDLTSEPRRIESALVNTNRVAVFTAGDTFYVGSRDDVFNVVEDSEGPIRLLQSNGLGSSSNFQRSRDYDVELNAFRRDFLAGFLSGSNAYFIVADHNPNDERSIRIMRVCHETGCPGGSSMCEFTALYEEDIRCGPRLSGSGDTVCGMSVVEDFGGVSGTSLLISRCREKSPTSNLVCLYSLSDLDGVMDDRFDRCVMDDANDQSDNEELQVAWRSGLADLNCAVVTTEVSYFIQ